MKRTFKIVTLGCKVNQFESESLFSEMDGTDLLPAGENEPADICIINTCSVTQKAAMQSRQAIRQAVRSNPGARIMVTGCYAQTEPEEIDRINGVQTIVGHGFKDRLADIIQNRGPASTHAPVHGLKTFQSMKCLPMGVRTRPFLKIQDGCDSFCSYCIVPHARGPSRSLPVESVIRHVDHLRESGFYEVVLTGIHLGAYGTDLSPASNLCSLLKNILQATGIQRIRMSSLEPRELTDEILGLASDKEDASWRICRHFHIPLQSGDDRVLEKMGRPYTSSYFKDLVLKVKEYLPEAAIGADTLIGFPGEDDQAFDRTYGLIRSLPVSYLHVFPFSPRKGTPAYQYEPRIDPRIVKKRCEKMRQLSRQKRKEFYTSFIGSEFEILVEGKPDRLTGLLKGFTSNYIPVLIPGAHALKNQFVRVKIDRLDHQGRVFGVLV